LSALDEAVGLRKTGHRGGLVISKQILLASIPAFLELVNDEGQEFIIARLCPERLIEHIARCFALVGVRHQPSGTHSRSPAIDIRRDA